MLNDFVQFNFKKKISLKKKSEFVTIGLKKVQFFVAS